MNLKDRTIIVTGGSLGIGQAIALEAATQGARVIIAARQQGPLVTTLDKLREVSPDAGHDYKLLDVGKEASVTRFAKWCRLNLKSVDGLVNSAGIYGPIGPLGELSLDDFADTLRINLMGTVHMCQALLPQLLKSPVRPKIVNMAGGGAARAFPRYSAYACSKVAVCRFTENLSMEYPKVDANCIAPGFVLTRMHQQTLEAGPEKASDFYQTTKDNMAEGGISPEKAAKLACFLLGPKSDGITGRFLSAPSDPWSDEKWLKKLKNDANLARLRRVKE